MMRIFGFILFSTAFLTTLGQACTSARILIDKVVFDAEPSSFEFKKYDTTLTVMADHYLNTFGEWYLTHLHEKHQFIIELTPGSTESETQACEILVLKRLNVIVNYLKQEYQVDVARFRGRYTSVVRFDGCDGFLTTPVR